MKKKERKFFLASMLLLLALAGLLGGCATTSNFKVADVHNLQGGEGFISVVELNADGTKSVSMTMDPYATLGILKTQAIAEGRFTAVEGIFPDIRFGEYFPGAIAGRCLAVASEKEFFCQTVLYRLAEDSSFRQAFLVEGSPEEVAAAKIVAISLKGDFAYDLYGREIVVVDKIYESSQLRLNFINENGTRADEFPIIVGLAETILTWNEYSAPEGVLLSPISEEQVKYIASINPQYSFADKLIGTGNFTLKPDPTGVLAGLALDVFRAMNAPTTGWDYNSQLPGRRNMGLIIEYVGRLRQQMFQVILTENRKLRDNGVGGAPRAREKKIEVPENSKKPALSIKSKTPTPPDAEKNVGNGGALVKNITKLGFSEKEAAILAKKIIAKDGDIVEILNRSVAKSLVKEDGEVVSPARLVWGSNTEYFRAERYRNGGNVVYRVGKNMFTCSQ